jgi:hypothetical protein
LDFEGDGIRGGGVEFDVACRMDPYLPDFPSLVGVCLHGAAADNAGAKAGGEVDRHAAGKKRGAQQNAKCQNQYPFHIFIFLSISADVA